MKSRLAHRTVFFLATAVAAMSGCEGSDTPSEATTGLEPSNSTTSSSPGADPGGTVSQPVPPASDPTPNPPVSGPATTTPPPAGTGGAAPLPSASGGASTSAGGSPVSSSGSGGEAGSPAGGTPGMSGGGSGGTPSGGNGGQSGGGPAGSAGMSAGGEAGSSGMDGDPVPSSGCGAADWPSSDTYDIDISGQNREYILRIPDDYDPTRPYRLILSFHWLNGTAQNVANGGGTTTGPYYGLWDLAEGSTIFVAPQGINNSWPSGNVPFAEALIDRLTSEFCIDESRIFSTGFSMGGSMSYAVACGLGSRIRGVAVYSGGPMSGCDPHDEPVAYFMSHGTQDSVCTYPGFGVPQIEDFAEVNGCTPRQMPNPSGNQPSCVDYEGCMDGYPARACIFVGDHTPSPGGQNSWVPQEAWDFLSQF